MLGLKCRIYPSEVQQQRFINSLRLCRDLHNHLLQYCKEGYKKANEAKFSPTAFAMNYEVTRFKKEHPEYTEVWSQTLQGVSNHLGSAYSSFFRRVKEKQMGRKVKVGFPRFKKKLYSLLYPGEYGVGYKLEGNKILNVSKIGRMPIKLDRAPEGSIKTMAIVKDGNRWFACFSTDYKKKMDKLAEKRTPVGIDLGLENFATISHGTKKANPKFYRNAQKRIKLLQRRLSKKKKGSKNRKKAGMRLWQAHQRVQDLRMNFLHQFTTELVRNHFLIAIEDLKIGNMLHNHSLAGSIADAGWGTFRNCLAYKAESAGSQVVYVNPKNTSQTCSCCGKVLEGKLKLSQRMFRCPCGYSEDRDVNAAKNILAIATAGRAGSQACGEAVSTLGEGMNLEQAASKKQELYGGVNI